MLKILVTGSAGNIGSRLVNHLIETGNVVYGADNMFTGKRKNVSEKAYKNFWHVDLRQRKNVEFLMRVIKPDIVFHCAKGKQEDINSITDNNLGVFLNTVASTIKSGIKRFVVISNMQNGEEGMYKINRIFIEDAIEILANEHGFEYAIIRVHSKPSEEDIQQIAKYGFAKKLANKSFNINEVNEHDKEEKN